MKKNWCFHLILITIMVLFFQNGALAESQTKPIQLSIFDPIQIFNSDTSIHGFRFNLIYGFNRDVSGLGNFLADPCTDPSPFKTFGPRSPTSLFSLI